MRSSSSCRAGRPFRASLARSARAPGRTLGAGLLLSFALSAFASEVVIHPGERLAEALERFRAAGVAVAYSTQLVPPRLRVREVPRGDDSATRLRRLLAPHGLGLRIVDGLHLVVRDASQRGSSPTGTIVVIGKDRDSQRSLDRLQVTMGVASFVPDDVAPGVWRLAGLSPRAHEVVVSAPGYQDQTHRVDVGAGQTRVLVAELAEQPTSLPDMVVATSRYRLPQDIVGTRFMLDPQTVESLPDFGDDPLRAVHRLPGVAAGGVSARSHVRGGADDETEIVLNGARLLDPFHVRDYQSLFSAIDLRAVEAVDVYTGGFPVDRGERMSGLILLESARPTRSAATEIGLGVLNTSLLSTGWFNDAGASWLVSARSGNLEHLIDRKYGEPAYRDLFAEIAGDTRFGRLSGNVLFADDRVSIFFENETDEIESSVDRTRAAQGWVRLQTELSPTLTVDTVIDFADLQSRGDALLDDEERLVATASDRRDTQAFGMRQDWTWQAADDHRLQWGYEWRRLDGRYRYDAEAEYFGFTRLLTDSDTELVRSVDLAVEGDSGSFYLSDRWQAAERLVIEAGLRWDGQDYERQSSSNRWSPRVSALWQMTPATEFRAGWGQFRQAQAPWELPIEDGVTRLSEPQRADQIILGLRHTLNSGVSLRLEAFEKRVDSPWTRYENLYNPRALVPELEPDRVTVDPDEARARGLEVGVAGAARGTVDWWAHYTLSQVTDRIDGRNIPRAWDQRHAFQAGAVWRPGQWELGAAFGAHSGWPITTLALTDAEEPALIVGARNRERLSTFFSLDLRVSRDIAVRHGRLNVYFELSNASDRRNDCCRDFDLLEDDDGLLLLERQKDYWLPLLPTAGLRWTF